MTEEAEKYAGLFNATRRDANIAVRASKAYQTIVDVLEEARTAALDANKAAEEAYEQARPGKEQIIMQTCVFESTPLLLPVRIEIETYTELI